MKRVLARTVYMVIVLVLSSIAVFYAIRLSGGDAVAARVPASASAEEREAVREQLGLNDPFHEQYFTYVGRILSGDLGNSLTNNAQISKLITEHGKNSLILGVAAFVLVFGLGIPLGMLASLRRNSWWDGGIMSFSVAGMAVPNFWLALLAVWLFASVLGWLPSAGCCSPKQFDPAGGGPRDGGNGAHRPDDPLCHAREPQPGLRAYAEGGRIVGGAGYRQARVPQRPGPDRLFGRSPYRADRRLRPGGRDHIRVARPGPGAGQRGAQARLSGGSVLLAGADHHRPAQQLDGRCRVYDGQPPAAEVLMMTQATDLASGRPGNPGSDIAPVLSVRGLRTAVTSRGESFDVVRDLSLDIYPNEILCLVGESGCGKSITALSVMRLLPTPPVRVGKGEFCSRVRIFSS